MYRACIAVVDATRARLFTLDRTMEAGELREELSERADFVHPARRHRPSELFSDSRPGTSRTGGLQYAFDDHRDAHIDALDAEFSRMIVDELAALIRSTGAQRLILCASPRMLGQLRSAGRELFRGPLAIDEVPRDLVKLTPTVLREQLASYGLLPPVPSRPGAPGTSAVERREI
jgi:protein required for attachment to host cells